MDLQRTRALLGRETFFKKTGDFDGLPEGNQGFLHETEPGRKDGCRDGRPAPERYRGSAA